jgi:two-component system, OmpR family, sensor kinase
MSLRSTLILGVLTLVAVVIGTLSISVYFALQSFFIARLDNQLNGPPWRVDVFCAASAGRVAQVPSRFYVARISADGGHVETCRESEGAGPLQLSGADAARLIGSLGQPIMVDSGGTEVRAVAKPLRSGDGFGVLAIPMTEVHDTLTRLLVLELAIGGLALAAAAAIGWLGIRLSLRPLTNVTRTALAVAEDVSAGDGRLERRVLQARPNTEVGQLAQAFNQMLAEVQKEIAVRKDSESRMRQFLADASHELRTPLTTLRGYAELLRLRAERNGDNDGPDARDALWRVESEGTRMAKLVEDLLALARADQQPVGPFEEVRLDRLAADAVADLRTAHPERAVVLDAEQDVVVHGSRDQLQQVLVNLLTNAAVHTEPSGEIRVAVRRRHGDVEIVVDDEGPGLDPQQAARVFDRFWRADRARSRARGGSGLGLSIVDALVAAHGGRVRFASTPRQMREQRSPSTYRRHTPLRSDLKRSAAPARQGGTPLPAGERRLHRCRPRALPQARRRRDRSRRHARPLPRQAACRPWQAARGRWRARRWPAARRSSRWRTARER